MYIYTLANTIFFAKIFLQHAFGYTTSLYNRRLEGLVIIR